MAKVNPELIRVLSDEADTLQSRRNQLEKEAERVSAELTDIKKRQELVLGLLGISRRPMGRGRGIIIGLMEEVAGQDYGTTAFEGRGNGARRDVAELAYEILVARGKKPMYYEELAAEVVKAGGHLGGATPAQTLVARISRDQRFVRPEKRGWYAAREFYPKAKNVGARKPGSPRDKKSAETRRRATK